MNTAFSHDKHDLEGLPDAQGPLNVNENVEKLSINETKETVKSIKRGKAVGINDEITTEVIKAAGEPML